MKMKKKMKFKCEICGTEFESSYKQAKYCCDECRWIGAKKSEAKRIRRKKEKKEQKQDLFDLVNRANAAGLTYGQFILKTQKG